MTCSHGTCSQPGPWSQAGCRSEYRTPHSQITPCSPHCLASLCSTPCLSTGGSREQQDLQSGWTSEEAGFKAFADLRPTQDIFETSLYKSAAFLSAHSPHFVLLHSRCHHYLTLFIYGLSPQGQEQKLQSSRDLFCLLQGPGAQNSAWYMKGTCICWLSKSCKGSL